MHSGTHCASQPALGDRINSYAVVSYIPGALGEFITRLREELVKGCVAQSHVTILPLLFGLLIAVHIFLVKQHGISPKVTPEATTRSTAGEGDSRFSIHLQRMVGYGLLVLGVAQRWVGVLCMGLFSGTLAIFVIAPAVSYGEAGFPSLSLAGQFLLKDLVLFAASLALVGLAPRSESVATPAGVRARAKGVTA